MSEQYVWVVMRGTCNEGGHIVGIFADRYQANKSFEMTARETERNTGNQAVIAVNESNEIDKDRSALVGDDWVDLVRHEVK